MGLIVGGVAGHAKRLALDQIGAQTGAGVLGGAVDRVVDGEDIVAVHDFGWDAEVISSKVIQNKNKTPAIENLLIQ